MCNLFIKVVCTSQMPWKKEPKYGVAVNANLDYSVWAAAGNIHFATQQMPGPTFHGRNGSSNRERICVFCVYAGLPNEPTP